MLSYFLKLDEMTCYIDLFLYLIRARDTQICIDTVRHKSRTVLNKYCIGSIYRACITLTSHMSRYFIVIRIVACHYNLGVETHFQQSFSKVLVGVSASLSSISTEDSRAIIKLFTQGRETFDPFQMIDDQIDKPMSI